MRYSDLHFSPDPIGDLLFNNVATDVVRSTFVNGVQGDLAYKLNDAHTLRVGFITQGEQTLVRTLSTVEPLDGAGDAIDSPIDITDKSSLLGWQVGVYLQDEWKLTRELTLNAGLRYDQIWQYVDKDQLSPRIGLQWQPWWSTTLHAGYAKYFTPPDQALGVLPQTQLLDGTTGQVPPLTKPNGPILPERSDVFDVGIVQQLLPKCSASAAKSGNCQTLVVGFDAYKKFARDLIDDGQFRQAYILSAFNYDRGIVQGLEFKLKYTKSNFTFYTNWALGWEKATRPVSNLTLFDPGDLPYLDSHWVFTDHSQTLTGSAGISYLFSGTGSWWLDDIKISSTLIYGSGLRTDGVLPDGSACPNCAHVPAYTQVNLGLSKEFKDTGWNPFTVRFDIVNLFDQSYEIRDGSGIGVFAPQFGPRRGYFVGLTQKF
jgi:outer membrane receptor protein involved in Fe transport